MFKIIKNIHYAFLFLGLSAAVPIHAQFIIDVAPEPSDKVLLGAFSNGYAQISVGGKAYFINKKGEKLRIYDGLTWRNPQAVELYEKGAQRNDGSLPKGITTFEKNGYHGIISPNGDILIPAEYDRIDFRYTQFWELYKDGKKSLYLPSKQILPFFDDLGYLDGEYFDVKQNGKWHIYSVSEGKIITEQVYDGFDYCGGCGTAASYVYAEKGGKWGVIDWAENVLVPFEYEHTHQHMRSDNWIRSFSKNGKAIIVHIPTKREFDQDRQLTKLVAGNLITTADGKMGAYNSSAELTVPFVYDRIDEPNPNHYLGYNGHYLIVANNHRKGVVRLSDGKLMVPLDYEEIAVYDDYFVVSSGEQTLLLEAGKDKPLLAVEHGKITHSNDYFYSSGSKNLNVFSVKQKAYYGIYFADSGVYYEPAYYDVSLINDGFFEHKQIVVADKQGQKTLFDAMGKPILPFEVQDYALFDKLEEPLLSIKVNNQWGLYDLRQQKEIIPPLYDRFFDVLEGAAQPYICASLDGGVFQNNRVLYDTEGQKIIEQPFLTIEDIDGKHFLVTRKGTEEKIVYAIFNAETKDLKPLPYRFVSLSGSSKLLVVSNDGKEGKLYDIAAAKELKRVYRTAIFSGQVTDEDDKAGASTALWLLHYFNNGTAMISSNNGNGFIDEREQIVIPPKFTRAKFFSKNYIAVADADTYLSPYSYFIDTEGKRRFPKEYVIDDIIFYNMDTYTYANNSVLLRVVDQERLVGMGDVSTGKIVIPAIYHQVIPTPNAPYLILVQDFATDENNPRHTEQKFGLAKMNGEIIFEPQFDEMDIRNNSFQSWNENEESLVDDIFPILIRMGDTWKYVRSDGSFLPIKGDGVRRW